MPAEQRQNHRQTAATRSFIVLYTFIEWDVISVECDFACVCVCVAVGKKQIPHLSIEHELKLIVFAFNRQEMKLISEILPLTLASGHQI